MEVLGFIIGLITNDTGELGHTDMSIFGLELMYTALNGGRSGQSIMPLKADHSIGGISMSKTESHKFFYRLLLHSDNTG